MEPKLTGVLRWYFTRFHEIKKFGSLDFKKESPQKMDLNGSEWPLRRLAFPNQTAKDVRSVQLFHIDHGVKCPQPKTDGMN